MASYDGPAQPGEFRTLFTRFFTPELELAGIVVLNILAAVAVPVCVHVGHRQQEKHLCQGCSTVQHTACLPQLVVEPAGAQLSFKAAPKPSTLCSYSK